MTQISRRNLIATSLLAAPSLALLPSPVGAQFADVTEPLHSEAEQIGIDAYIYGYSLITTEVTRVQMTNVAKADDLHAPIGQFINVRRYPPADYRGVSAPNADTLYSIAWLDLGPEPMVFSHPDMGDRYYLLPMYSLWMPVVAPPGTRTTGGKAAMYLLTGPGWTGAVPTGTNQIKSPTRYMLILGRTYADGTEQDYRVVNKLQDEYKAYPLSAQGKPYTFVPPPVDPSRGFSMTEKPQQVIDTMDIAAYFNMMAHLMGSAAPAAPEDAPIVSRMAKIGLVPGQRFDLSKLSQSVQEDLKEVPKIAFRKIAALREAWGVKQNGWHIAGRTGTYGTNYLDRALIAAFGWPANLPQDAMYPYTFEEGTGQRLTGANKYTVTFAKGLTPPVDGFWSITMYIIDGGWWFYPNSLNQFTVSLRNNLKLNADGSLTLYFQNESPGADKEANWLPAPKDEFLLMLRMYWPKETEPSILPPGHGTWTPPPVIRAG
ncbi:MAG: DUF1254 domain-containing protein [Acetobacteraceae bacterium]